MLRRSSSTWLTADGLFSGVWDRCPPTFMTLLKSTPGRMTSQCLRSLSAVRKERCVNVCRTQYQTEPERLYAYLKMTSSNRPNQTPVAGLYLVHLLTKCFVYPLSSQARRILELTPVRQLVRLKWNLYGKHYFRYLTVTYYKEQHLLSCYY